MMYNNELSMDDLDNVVGGVGTNANPAAKFGELKAAARKLGMDLTAHRLEAIADKWEETGFELSAEEFLANFN